MKALSQLSLLVLMLLPLSCGQTKQAAVETGRGSRHVMSFGEIEKQFLDPNVEYSTAPFWVWNNDMSEEVIDEQLDDMLSCGIKALIIHPRPGLITPYISDRWNELVKYAVDQGKAKGMELWLYDENSYPSGFAGGNVPAEMPESYNEGQGLVYKKVDKIPENDDAEYVTVLKKNGVGFIDVTDSIEGEKGKTGDYRLFVKAYYGKSPWYGGYSYVDLLKEGVTEKFIEVTMRGYEQYLGDNLGTVVPGVFTDEPNIAPPGGGCIRWTPSLFERFSQRWGYDLQPNLVSLFDETGDWKRVRHNYYGLMLELFIERWSKPWYEYTEQHGLLWTGHYWEHGWPSPHHGGDNMAMYAWHQVPAIDILMNEYSGHPNAQFGNDRAVKELRSAANQTGSARTLSETYGAGGWDLRFEDMKRINDWQYVLGVNLTNQHLSYVTIAGARKRDHPQSFSYHDPWWHLYKYSAEYYSRLSLALSAGKQVNHILVLEPTTSAWMYYSSTTANDMVGAVGTSFQNFVHELEEFQVEYDIGCENIIMDRGSVSGKQFIVGECAYDTVVLPPNTENIDLATAALLEKFCAGGGKVLAFCKPPIRVDGVETSRLLDLAENQSTAWQSYVGKGIADCFKYLVSDDIEFEKTSGGILFHHRRQLDDGQLIFLANTSLEENAECAFRTKGASVQKLDPHSGSITPFECETSRGAVAVSIDLPPAGSLLLYVDSKGTALAPSKEKTLSTVVKAEAATAISAAAPNVLTLDYCDLTLDGKKEKGLYFFQAARKIYKHHGFNANPWEHAVQFKSEILDKDNFPADSGFIADFHFTVEKGADCSGLQAVVERPGLWNVLVNGKAVEANPGEWRLDRLFGVYDIGAHVKAGDNVITLNASPMTVHSELEPVYLYGDFGLESGKKGWTVTKPQTLTFGPWTEQKMPFYSDAVSYKQSYMLEKGANYKVSLGDWYGCVAEVRVNGVHAGIIGWKPFECDITDFVRDGGNEVEVLVYGTLKNQMGPHHNGQPRGRAWPNMFQAAPEKQPAGSDYDVIGYGLFGKFELIQGK